jgi:hypothetical protein
MSDGFPSGSCANVILSHGETVEAADHFLASSLVPDKDHTMCEVRTRSPREPRASWTVMRAERSIVGPESEEERSGK